MSKTRERHGPQRRTLGERLWGSARNNGRRRRAASPPLRVRYTPFGAEMTTWGGSGTGGYHSAKYLRDSGRVLAGGGSTDALLRYDLEDLRAESQRQFRDNPFYRGIIQSLTNVAIGRGLTLHARSGDRKLDEELEAWWEGEWSGMLARPTLRARESGRLVERMLFQQYLVDGDLGVLRHGPSGKIQLVEGERIGSLLSGRTDSGRRVESGIETDRWGRPLAYHVADYDDRGMVQIERRRIPAADMSFLALLHRSDQTRGEPLLQILLPMFHRINDVCDSEAAAWQILSKLVFRLSTSDGAKFSQLVGSTDANASTEDLARRVVDIGDAIIFVGEADEEIAGVERNIPSASFPDSLKMFIRTLGVTIGLPLEFILMIWSDTSWSSGRMAGKQAQRACGPLFDPLHADGISPAYTWKLGREIGRGTWKYRAGIFRHEFLPEPYPQMDPTKEIDAAAKRIATGLSTPTRESRHLDLDWEELCTQREQDIRTALEHADAINSARPGVQIGLQHFMDIGGKAKGGSRSMMEDIARAVRSGVPISVGEARAIGLGLPGEPADEQKLRFKDQDLLQYHIENGVVTINEARKVLRLPAVPWGDVPVRKSGVRPVTEEDEDTSTRNSEPGTQNSQRGGSQEGADGGDAERAEPEPEKETA